MAFVDSMKAKVDSVRAREAALAKQARERIPAEYHSFLIFLDQNQKISDKQMENPDQLGPGVWSSQRGIFVPVRMPYMAVDGRVQMFVDEHRKAGKTFKIGFINEWASTTGAIGGVPGAPEELKTILTCVVTSEIYGSAAGSAKISWGGEGVDRTNPYENAQTSALGRALANMGLGLLGTGIASYEEVKGAIEEQERLDRTEPRAEAPAKQAAAPMPGPKPPKAETDPNDPSLATDSGPCADCGVAIPKGGENAIKNSRKRGEAVRWSHQSVPGLQGLDENGKCNNPIVLKQKAKAE